MLKEILYRNLQEIKQKLDESLKKKSQFCVQNMIFSPCILSYRIISRPLVGVPNLRLATTDVGQFCLLGDKHATPPHTQIYENTVYHCETST